jgi:hypothetical protein
VVDAGHGEKQRTGVNRHLPIDNTFIGACTYPPAIMYLGQSSPVRAMIWGFSYPPA